MKVLTRTQMTGLRECAEELFGHPMQYAYIGGIYVGDTEDASDEDVRRVAGLPGSGLHVERYNRCPTCEQWSPCDVRRP